MAQLWAGGCTHKTSELPSNPNIFHDYMKMFNYRKIAPFKKKDKLHAS